VSSEAAHVEKPSIFRVFGGLMVRDALVLRRELFSFASRTIMNPLLFVFVFAYVFPRIGQSFRITGGTSFATILVPGLVGSAIMFQGISAVALPLVLEFGATREIEDRVMAPLRNGVVGVEKVVFAGLQGCIAAAVVFPLVYLIPATPVQVHVHNWALLLGVIVLSGLVAGALGLAVGTAANPRQVGLIFALIVIPVNFLGAIYYPWARLAPIKWLQYLVLINPLVYMSEGLRTALTPEVPHMHIAAFIGALLASFLILMWLGMRGFIKRTVF
jgi:ABC-2 type transport system permease protein